MAIHQVVEQDGQKVLVEVPVGGIYLATSETPGAVQPDGVTTKVDSSGVLSALGGNLLFNDEIWITESGTFTASVDGIHEVLIIDGGSGGQCFYNNGYVELQPGGSGSYASELVFLHAGTSVPITIGAGGNGTTVIGVSTGGGVSKFGNVTPTNSANLPRPMNYGTTYLPSFININGGGYNFYGAGGKSSFVKPDSVTPGNGIQGAIRVRFHNPAKANGPVE